MGEGGSRRLTDEELVLRLVTPHPPLTRSPFPHWGRHSLIAWSKNDNFVVVLNLALRSTAFVPTKAKPRARRGEDYKLESRSLMFK